MRFCKCSMNAVMRAKAAFLYEFSCFMTKIYSYMMCGGS